MAELNLHRLILHIELHCGLTVHGLLLILHARFPIWLNLNVINSKTADLRVKVIDVNFFWRIRITSSYSCCCLSCLLLFIAANASNDEPNNYKNKSNDTASDCTNDSALLLFFLFIHFWPLVCAGDLFTGRSTVR
jgi:hypothetical protein